MELKLICIVYVCMALEIELELDILPCLVSSLAFEHQ